MTERYGFAVDEAANGADGVRELRTAAYDVVFIDVLMPRMDGWGVLDFLRTRKARPRHIVLVSEMRDLKLSQRDSDLVTELLLKPAGADELFGFVSRLSGASASREATC